MKQCISCLRVLALTEFYAHAAMSDGHLNKCKECCRAASKARIERMKEDPVWVIRERRRSFKKNRAYKKAGIVYPYKPGSRKETNAKYRAAYPEKRKAHVVTGNAIRDGRLTPKPCEVCGRKAEAHHDDYSKPLAVRWLCRKHHVAHHVKARLS